MAAFLFLKNGPRQYRALSLGLLDTTQLVDHGLKRLRALLLILLGLVVFLESTEFPSEAATAQTQPPDVRAVVAAAIASRKSQVIIPPGVYPVMPDPGTNVHWTIRGARKLEIIADGVTIICQKRWRALAIEDCENLKLRGLTIDYNPLTFTQGKVVAVSDDKSSIDVRIDIGYPVAPYTRINVVDPRTRFRKQGMPFLWGTKALMVSPGIVRVTLKGIGLAAQTGDLATLSAGPEPGGLDHGIVIRGSARTTLEKVTVHCAPGMGIIDGAGEGGTHLLECRIVPGPKPKGATEERLLSTSWDALLHTKMRQGPTVENCIIELAGDDSWSVGGADAMLLKCQGRALILSHNDYQPGDRLERFRNVEQARIAQSEEIPLRQAELDEKVLRQTREAKSYTPWHGRLSGKLTRVTLDHDVPWQVGDLLYSPDRQGNGFIFRNNHVHNPGRVLVKGGSGRIEGNTLEGMGKAIVVCPEKTGDCHAGCGFDMVIRNNTIRETGYGAEAPWSSQVGAICLTSPKVKTHPAFDHITIENNTFDGVRGVNLAINDAANVLVKGNRFLRTGQVEPSRNGETSGIDPDCVVWVSNSEEVRFENNEIDHPGPFVKQPLHLSSTSLNVIGSHDGVRVRP